LAGLVYMLGPYTFGYGFLISAAFPPYVLLPVVLLITIRGLRTKGPWWPALFGLTVFVMGGGNGGPQVYAMVPAVLFGVWVLLVERERSVPVRRVIAFFGWAALFTVGLNAYWLASLASPETTNALAFSEQPNIINVASSFSETIRGLGFWQFYGGTQFGPWDPTVRSYLTSPVLIVTGFAVPIVALLSAWLLRWRYRLFFLLLAILGVVGMAGIFPTASSSPFGHLLLFAYDHVPGAAGLRTTYKLGGTLNLALAVLFALGVDALWASFRGKGEYELWRLLVAVATAVILVANAYPLVLGRIQGERNTAGIPAYWTQALNYLERRGGPEREFFAPGTLQIVYRWGGLVDGVAETRPQIASVIPWPFPVNEHYQTNLLAAVERPYQQDLPSNDSAALFRYLGVRDVVLQNDIDWQRSTTARPAEMQLLAKDPSLDPLTSFGLPGQNTVARGSSQASDPSSGAERHLPPVEILIVPNALPPARVEAGAPVVVSGDGFGIASLAEEGTLRTNPPVLYSGDLTAADLAGLAADGPSFVVTDSNRRVAYSFDAPRDNHSYTLPAGATLGDRAIGYG
ncbi:MAG TPA: hypothetical protein DIT48_00085, partial [Actinobacteria bacterium]|nr:hypothetical protein [Actinomycetota bacterium]